jgi:hypothetical protein
MGNRAGYLRVTEQFASFRKTCMSKSNQIAATASGINWIYEIFSFRIDDLVMHWQDCINYYYEKYRTSFLQNVRSHSLQKIKLNYKLNL